MATMSNCEACTNAVALSETGKCWDCSCNETSTAKLWARERLAALAHNLAIAAFGQRMFELGSEYRMRAMLGLPASEDWTPGCGKQAE